MPELVAFNPIVYDPRAVGVAAEDISALLAPPYDHVDAALRTELLAVHPRNVAVVDSPPRPAETDAGVGVGVGFDEARSAWQAMRSRGMLVPYGRPVLAVVRQTFREADAHIRRRLSVWGTLRLDPDAAAPAPGPRPDPDRDAGTPRIRAHEETDAAPCAERLELMRALRAQTSPLFGLHDDPDGRVEDRLRHVMLGGGPDRAGVTPDGVLHEMWIVHEPEVIDDLRRAFGDRDVIIADGHHRHASARDYLAERGADVLPADHPARHCLFGLVAIQDPGMTVHAKHLLVSGLDAWSLERFEAAAAEHYEIHDLPGRSPEELPALVAREGHEKAHAVALVDVASGATRLLLCRSTDPLAETLGDRHARWRQSEPVVARHFLIERLLGPFSENGGTSPRIEPVSDPASYRSRVVGASPPEVALFLEPVALPDVLGVARSGPLLPAESTHFSPKLASGLLMHDLA